MKKLIENISMNSNQNSGNLGEIIIFRGPNEVFNNHYKEKK